MTIEHNSLIPTAAGTVIDDVWPAIVAKGATACSRS